MIDKYTAELNDDIKIDYVNVRDVQMKLPAIKHKWVARLINHKIERDNTKKKIIEAREIIIRKLEKEAKTVLSRPTLEKAANDHEAILKLRKNVDDIDMIIEYLEKVEKILSSTTFDIKNLVEIMKLEQL